VKDDRRAIIDPTTDLNITLSFCHTNFLPLYHYKILLEQHGYRATLSIQQGEAVSKRVKFKLLRDK
jgi:hypothetical protein